MFLNNFFLGTIRYKFGVWRLQAGVWRLQVGVWRLQVGVEASGWSFGGFRLEFCRLQVGVLEASGWSLEASGWSFGGFMLEFWRLQVGVLEASGWSFGGFRLEFWRLQVGVLEAIDWRLKASGTRQSWRASERLGFCLGKKKKNLLEKMEKLAHCLISLCFLTVISFYGVIGQFITIFPYKQSDSRTSCTEGLLANSDILEIKGEAHFGENSSLTTYITFRKFVKSRGYLPLCLLDIRNTQSENNCSFKVTERKNVYSFFISLAAVEELSEGKIIGSLMFTNSTEEKHQISLPKIYKYDPATVAMLTINGEKVNPDCNITVFDHLLKIEARCKTLLEPCLLQFNFNDKEPLKKNNDLLFEKIFDESASVSVVLRAKVCDKEISENLFECRIWIELGNKSATTLDAGSTDSTAIIIGVTLAAIVVICVICFILYKRGIFKCKRKAPTQPDAESSAQASVPLIQERKPAEDGASVPLIQERKPAEDGNSFIQSNVKRLIGIFEPIKASDKANVSLLQEGEPSEDRLQHNNEVTVQASPKSLENVDSDGPPVQASPESPEIVDSDGPPVQASPESPEIVDSDGSPVQASPESPEIVDSDGSPVQASPESPENVDSDGSSEQASPESPENVDSDGSSEIASQESPENVDSDGSSEQASPESPENVDSDGSSEIASQESLVNIDSDGPPVQESPESLENVDNATVQVIENAGKNDPLDAQMNPLHDAAEEDYVDV
ncbi:hypothetical protein Btru_071842 [Bulinus truncatus]|nr:hypothetical protein Btru_071842 [Bulinus truncatus]